MFRRSLSAYEKFLLAQTSESQNGEVPLKPEDDEAEHTGAADKVPAAEEEEKKLSEPILPSTPAASSSLTAQTAATVHSHSPYERRESAAATSSLQQQRQQRRPAASDDVEQQQDDEEKEDDEDDQSEDADDDGATDDGEHEAQSEELPEGGAEDEQLYRPFNAPPHRAVSDSDEQYAGADELGLLDDVDALPIEGLSPLPVDREESEAEVEEEPVLQQDEPDEEDEDEQESAADTLSPLPQYSEQQQEDDDDGDGELQSEPESGASESSVDGELDDKIHAHKAALSHYAVQPTAHSHTAPTANADDANLLSTVREGNEDDEHTNRTGSSSATPTASAHRWFSDLVNRPSFLSPNSPTAAPSRFSLSSRHSTPNERALHSRKRSSLPSPSPASTSLHSSWHHPEYNSPSAFFAAKSGQMGSLSGSRSNRPSFSTPLEAPAAGELGSPSAVGRLSFTPFRRSGGRMDERRVEEREEAEQEGGGMEQEEKKINRSLVFHSPHRPQPTPMSRPTHRSSLPPRPPSSYPTPPITAAQPSTARTAGPANLHLLPSANLHHCHLFLHFHSTLPHSTLLPLVASTLRHHVPAAAMYSSLTDKGSRRWVMMCVLEGEGRWMDERVGWCESVEIVLVGYGMSALDFVVLLPSTAAAS